MNKFFFFLIGVTTSLHAFAGDKHTAGHPMAATDDKLTVPSLLRSATVYRSGAELTHTATASLRQGNNELIIGDISNNIDVNSLQIGCTGSVTIMSVEFSKEYLKAESKSFLILKLEDSLETVQKEQERLEGLTRAAKDLQELLKANKEIRGTNTGLNVSE